MIIFEKVWEAITMPRSLKGVRPHMPAERLTKGVPQDMARPSHVTYFFLPAKPWSSLTWFSLVVVTVTMVWHNVVKDVKNNSC